MRPALAEEAVSTSALEGTVAAIEDVLQAEFLDPSEVTAETIEVRNYITAAETALRLMRDENLPICRRLITQVNRELLAGTRGDSPDAGEFRARQNWIGEHRDVPITEALFVPPPEGVALERGLDDWEAWINETPDIPTVVRIALGHYQFETLHPFIDGNGRVGRLVAVLMLITSNSLTIPLVNLSPYLEERKDTYVEQLRLVSETGDFDPWVRFLAQALTTQSERALRKADRLIATRDAIVQRLHEEHVRGLAVRIADALIGTPVFTVTRAKELFNTSFQAANKAIARLEELGILREVTGQAYGRVFSSPAIMDVIRARE
jgi:Fic family protein